MSPSFAPTSMNAAITSVYIVIASWTPEMVVSRSATICEIDTFMTAESRTITNCAAQSTMSATHLPISLRSPARKRFLPSVPTPSEPGDEHGEHRDEVELPEERLGDRDCVRELAGRRVVA